MREQLDTCPQCGKPIRPNDTFCESCGWKLAQAAAPPAPGPAPAAAPQPPPAAAPAPPPPPAPVGRMGVIVFPDGKEMQVTTSQSMIRRVDFASHVSPDDLKYISREHLVVYQDGDKFYAEDAKSANKTFLLSGGNRDDITGKGKRELKDGDELSIADVVKLKFKTK